MMEKFTFRCDVAGIRLDKFLSHKTGISRNKVKRDILGGLVLVDGEIDVPDRRLKGGEVIEYTPSPPGEIEIVPEAIPIKIIYEDDNILVIDKPAGMVVHPGAGNYRGTLVNALLYWYNDWSINGYVRPGIVHRLDKDTSGLMVVARNEKSQISLIDQFKERRVHKKYLALVVGKTPNTGEINKPIGRDRYNRLKFSTNTTAPREAFTKWIVKERFCEITLLEVTPKTGRTHQIRVHLSWAGYPLVGDELYGGVKRAKKLDNHKVKEIVLSFSRHALHAEYLSFLHPGTGKKMEFFSPLPPDMESLITELRNHCVSN